MITDSVLRQSRETSGRFWRVLFWVTLIHFLIFGFGAAALVVNTGAESFRKFDTQNGWLSGSLFWVFGNTPIVWCALLAGNLPALFFCWRCNRRLPYSRNAVRIYLICDLAIAVAHVVSALHVTPGRTWLFGIGGFFYVSIVCLIVTWDLLAILPAVLILARLISSGWPARGKGLCNRCEYNLTGNVSGICPECGTPLDPRRSGAYVYSDSSTTKSLLYSREAHIGSILH